MSISPKDVYSGQIDTTDANYPEGKAQNVTVAGDGTGTPLEKTWLNDLWGFLQKLLNDAGITPSGTPDHIGASDYFDALADLFIRTIGIQNDGTRELIYVDGSGAADPQTRNRTIPAVKANFASGYAFTGSIHLLATADGATCYLPIDDPPSGGLVTVYMLVQPGAARATVGNRMTGTLNRDQFLNIGNPDGDGAVIEGSGTDDGTTNPQAVLCGQLSTNIDKSNHSVVLEVVAGADAGTNNDTIFGFVLAFGDPGPRNF